MKLKKILAALAACAMSAAMIGMSVSAEGEEVGDDTLDDTAATEEIGGEEEPAETTEPEAPEATEPEIPEVENEKTGNASVALAVIPVALAAAAVVAKKAK